MLAALGLVTVCLLSFDDPTSTIARKVVTVVVALFCFGFLFLVETVALILSNYDELASWLSESRPATTASCTHEHAKELVKSIKDENSVSLSLLILK